MGRFASWRGALRAAALLTLTAAALLPALPAEAQTNVWSATLTVDQDGNTFGCATPVNNPPSRNLDHCSSALTDEDFAYKGTTYTIRYVTWSSASGLRMSFGGDTRAHTLKTTFGSLKLKVGSDTFAIADAFASNTYDTFLWSSANLGWTDNQSVTLSLGEPAPVGGPK